MDQIIRIYIERLAKMGMEVSIIPAYIRDLANTLSFNADLSLPELNRKLQQLGWSDFELDNHTLQLIMAHLEAEDILSSGLSKPVWLEVLSTKTKPLKSEIQAFNQNLASVSE